MTYYVISNVDLIFLCFTQRPFCRALDTMCTLPCGDNKIIAAGFVSGAASDSFSLQHPPAGAALAGWCRGQNLRHRARSQYTSYDGGVRCPVDKIPNRLTALRRVGLPCRGAGA